MENSAIFKLPGFMFEPGATICIDGAIELGHMIMHGDEYTFNAPINYNAHITNTGEAFTVMGSAHATGSVSCARCLESVQQDFDCEFDAYVLNPESPEFCEDALINSTQRADSDFSGETDGETEGGNEFASSSFGAEDEFDILPRTHEIDLQTYIESAMRLAAPAMPLCKPDCKGLCHTCGANLNVDACSCAEAEKPDISMSPFAALADFKFEE